MRFKDIVGQRELIEKIIGAVNAGRIPHAQLFVGPEGNQKLALALAYAQYINCSHKVSAADGQDLNGLSSDSCGKCPSCTKFEKLAHPDLHFFFPNNKPEKDKGANDSKSSQFADVWRAYCLETDAEFSMQQWYEKMGIGNKQGIINVRDCTDMLSILGLKAFEAQYRVLIIWSVEKLNTAAAPKILKTLEEPAPNTVFLLISEDQDQILNTILSRTQIIRVPKLKEKDIYGKLIEKGFSESLASHAAKKANGNLLDALANVQNNETEILYYSTFVKWMRLCYKVDIAELNDLCTEISGLGRERCKDFIRFCAEELRLCLLLQYNNRHWVNADGEEVSFLDNFSKFINAENINIFNEVLNDCKVCIERNANAHLLFMNASLIFCKLISTQKKKQ